MAVLNVATTRIKDAGKMRAYIAAAAPLMRRYEAEVVVRGEYLKTLLGDAQDEHILGVFRFRDMETAESFYTCEDYMKLVPLRDSAGDMTFAFYEE